MLTTSLTAQVSVMQNVFRGNLNLSTEDFTTWTTTDNNQTPRAQLNGWSAVLRTMPQTGMAYILNKKAKIFETSNMTFQ